jgi:hypothetical protein
MFVKTVATIARFPLLVLPLALAASINCGSSSDSTGKGGSGGSGTGTAGSHAGTTGTGGSGTGGSGTGGTSLNCGVATATANDMTILDFNAVTAGATQAAFGGYMVGIDYGGGTYIYPNAATATDAMGLSNTFDGMNWHITGLVKDYAGFGLYLTSTANVSMFGGISFDISGTFTPTGAGDGGAPTMQATMTVTDVAHAVDSLHTADGSMTCGMCAPTTSQYDGTCASPTKVIPITSATVTQSIKWTDLTGGKRPPQFTGESPDPSKITAVAWALPWNGTGSAQYMVDIVIDNIKYLAP